MQISKNIDEIYPVIGELGLHQLLTLFILCLLVVPAAYQNLIIYFVAHNPSWKCVSNSTVCEAKGVINDSNTDWYEHRCKLERHEWEYVENHKYSVVTEFGLYCEKENLIFVAKSIMFAGAAVGAVVIGWLSDKYGRKKVFVPCSVIGIIVALLSSFSPSYWWFAASRLIIGLLSPGTMIIYFIVASEMTTTRHRSFTGISLWIFYTIALVILGVVAMHVRQWKWLMLYSTAPYFILMPLMWFIPESLRWFYVNEKFDDAQNLIKRIGNVNGKPIEKVHIAPPKITERSLNPLLLFSNTRLTLKTLNLGFAWMVTSLVYYGVSFASSDLSGNFHRDYILSSLVEFPAAVLAVLASIYLGRKRPTQLPLFFGGVFCAAVSGIHELEDDGHLMNLRVTFGLLGKFLITVSFDVIFIWTVELYPTQIRTEAMGFFQITSRVGAMLAPWVQKWLRKFHWRIPYTVMGALAVIASLILEWLPETKHKNTKEIIELPTVHNKPEQEVKLIKNPPRVRRDNTPKLVTIKSKPSRIIIG